jgi:acyl carrier protein
MITRTEILSIIQKSLALVSEARGQTLPNEFSETCPLLGPKSGLDSIALVMLVVNIEQTLAEDRQLLVTLADERAMSQRVSPFRSVGALASYVEKLVQEVKA